MKRNFDGSWDFRRDVGISKLGLLLSVNDEIEYNAITNRFCGADLIRDISSILDPQL